LGDVARPTPPVHDGAAHRDSRCAGHPEPFVLLSTEPAIAVWVAAVGEKREKRKEVALSSDKRKAHICVR
jgi:hypothetical protein